MIVLLAADVDEPFGRLALAADQFDTGRTAKLMSGTLALPCANVFADAAAVAHQVDAHNFRLGRVFSAGRLLLRAAGLDQAVALGDGILLDDVHRLLAGLVGAELKGGPDLRQLKRGDRLDKRRNIALGIRIGGIHGSVGSVAVHVALVAISLRVHVIFLLL